MKRVISNGKRSITIVEEERKNTNEFGTFISAYYQEKELFNLNTGLFKDGKKTIKKLAKIKLFNDFIALSIRQSVYDTENRNCRYSNPQIDILYTFNGEEFYRCSHLQNENFKPFVKWTEVEINKLLKVKSK